MAAPKNPSPRFVALLPFQRDLDALEVLKEASAAAAEAEKPKYTFTRMRSLVNGRAAADLRLLYRDEQETVLDERLQGWRSDADVVALLEYLFSTKFIVYLRPEGHLEISFPLPDKWSASQLEFLRVELGGQLFHVAKYVVGLLQVRERLPRDFEYKRHAVCLSETPETEIIERFTHVFADTHRDANNRGINVFEATNAALASRPKRAFFPIRLSLPSTLFRYGWIRSKRTAFVGKSLLNWYYGLLWHALKDHRDAVRERLGGRRHAACADLSDVEHQSELFISQQAAVSTETGVLLGYGGIASAVVIAGLSAGWPSWPLGVIIAVSALFLFKGLVSIGRHISAMAEDAVALCQVFRWNHPSHADDGLEATIPFPAERAAPQTASQDRVGDSRATTAARARPVRGPPRGESN